MLTLILLLSLLGFYTLYQTSQKAVLTASGKPELWVQAHPARGKLLGLLLLAAAAVLCLTHLGLGSGFFSLLVILMTVGSLVVILAPLQWVHYKLLTCLFLLSLLLELI